VIELVVLVAVVVFSTAERQFANRRHEQHITQLLAAKNPDLESMIALTDRLCQRLQAPEVAVMQHQPQIEPSPPAVDPNDDGDYWEDRDQLAERLMAQETSGAA